MKAVRLLFAVCAPILTVPGAQGQASVITGRVFDSLRLAPLAGVSVALSGTPLGTRTGADGTYRLVTELRGRRTLTFAEPRLDRFLGSVTVEVVLAPGSESRVDLAIPRRPPAPSELCATPASDTTARGGVVGVVRDSATGLPVSGALVAAYWASDSDTSGAARGVKNESGEDGGYLLCSLPTDRPVSLLSRTQGREVGLEGLRPSAHNIVDVDLLLGTPAEPGNVGRIRGRVTDSATGTGLAEADIMLLESGLHALSNATGDFMIDRVQPGRITMVARRVGYRPQFLEAMLPPGETASVKAVLRPAPVRLADLETRAASALEREGFVDRQRLGLGKFWDEAEIRQFDDRTLTSLLRAKSSVRESKGGILTNQGTTGVSQGTCAIPVLVDGVLLTGGRGSEFPTSLRPEQLAAAEYYARPTLVPVEFHSFGRRANGFQCGLLVFWTRGRY